MNTSVATQTRSRSRSTAAYLLVLAALCGMGGCSLLGNSSQPKPAELAPNRALLPARQVWRSKIPPLADMHLSVHVNGTILTLASPDGTVVALDALTGSDVWRTQLDTPLASGVGSNGRWAAVTTRDSQLAVLESGQLLWRKPLPALAYTAPLVAGGRVFVLTSDRSLSAFDAATGYRLWTRPHSGEPLILRQGGALLAVGDTLVAGLSGRLVGLDPSSGAIRWEAPLATPRGTNDVERLVDLVGPVSRFGSSVCVRAFGAAIGCVDTARGTTEWTQSARGNTGVAGDATLLVGTESNGTLVAWRRMDGARAWTLKQLQHRRLSAPLLLGDVVVVGDGNGLVHLLSRADASSLNRLDTDGSPIVAAPVAVPDNAATLVVVVTRNGGVYGLRFGQVQPQGQS